MYSQTKIYFWLGSYYIILYILQIKKIFMMKCENKKYVDKRKSNELTFRAVVR